MKRALDLVLLIAAGLVAWEAMHLAAPFALTSPAESLAKAWSMALSPVFWPHAAETAKAFAYTLLLAVGGGLALGLSLGLNRTSAEVAEPIMISAYSLPKVTLYPVILLIFGLGISAKIAFGVIHGIIPVILFTMNAVRNIRAVYLRSARAMRLTVAQTAGTIIIPAALPEIVSGFRIGFALTLLGTLIGEMFASQRGIGYMLVKAMETGDTATVMSLALLLVVLATAASAALLALDRRLRRHAIAA